jgi:hypothetical protein
VRRALLAAAALLVSVGPALGAEDDVIDPDRPDVTNSAKTVGRGRVQLETGVLYERTRLAASPAERRMAIEAALRVGLTESLELDIGAEPIVRLRGGVDETDVGDVTLGVKYRFLESIDGGWWPTLALNPFVKLPIAQEPIGSGRTDAGLVLLATFDLPWQFGLDVNAGAALIGQTRPSGHLVQARASASLSREVIQRLSTFVEVAYASREEWDGRDTLAVQAGLIWRVTRDLALDAAVSTGVLGSLPDFGVRVGGSVRFGR